MKLHIISIKWALFLLFMHSDSVLADRYSDAMCDEGCGSGGNPLDFIVLLVIIGYWWVSAMESYTSRLWFTCVIGGLSICAVMNSSGVFVMIIAWLFIGATILTWMHGADNSKNDISTNHNTNHEPKSKEIAKDTDIQESLKPLKQKPIRITETYRTHKSIPLIDEPLENVILTPLEEVPPKQQYALEIQETKCPFCRGNINMSTRLCSKCGTGFSTLPSLIFDDID